MKDHCFFLIKIYDGRNVEEWKNNIFIPIHGNVDKQKVENYRGFSLFNACCKI